MDKNKLFLGLTSIALCCMTFCIGYLLGKEQEKLGSKESHIIDITYKDTLLDISNTPENILFRVNGEIYEK